MPEGQRSVPDVCPAYWPLFRQCHLAEQHGSLFRAPCASSLQTRTLWPALPQAKRWMDYMSRSSATESSSGFVRRLVRAAGGPEADSLHAPGARPTWRCSPLLLLSRSAQMAQYATFSGKTEVAQQFTDLAEKA